MAARTFKEKKEQQSRVFFDVIFDVYSHVDNREKELERVIEDKGDEFLWKKKTWKFHSGGEKMRNASGQQGENERQWKSESQHEQRKQNLWKARTTIPPSCTCSTNLLIRSIDLDAIFIAVPV